jgi:predicted chitinase
MILTSDQLLAAAPHALPHIVAAICGPWDAVSAKYGLMNRNRALGFLSTAYEESGGFTVLTENLNYNATRAAQVFPHYFPTAASAAPFANNPVAFANKVYGGRMGNVNPGDGWKFRGQGLIQITGHDNFSALAKSSGLPLLDTPDMAASDDHMLECSVALFVQYPGILGYCDAQKWQAVWALVGSGRASGPVINLQNHLNALAALNKVLPAG